MTVVDAVDSRNFQLRSALTAGVELSSDSIYAYQDRHHVNGFSHTRLLDHTTVLALYFTPHLSPYHLCLYQDCADEVAI